MQHTLAQRQRIAPRYSTDRIAVEWIDLPQRETVLHRERLVQFAEVCLAGVHRREKNLAVPYGPHHRFLCRPQTQTRLSSVRPMVGGCPGPIGFP